jgi:hypothetical protein
MSDPQSVPVPRDLLERLEECARFTATGASLPDETRKRAAVDGSVVRSLLAGVPVATDEPAETSAAIVSQQWVVFPEDRNPEWFALERDDEDDAMDWLADIPGWNAAWRDRRVELGAWHIVRPSGAAQEGSQG